MIVKLQMKPDAGRCPSIPYDDKLIECSQVTISRNVDGNAMINLDGIGLKGGSSLFVRVGNSVDGDGKEISKVDATVAFIMENGKTVEVVSWKNQKLSK